MQVIISVYDDDTETIKAVKEAVKYDTKQVIKLHTFKKIGKRSKSCNLNAALTKAKGDYIVIFDAEDEVDIELLGRVNKIIKKEGRKIIQTTVSLMNWRSNWFCLHSVLEYYFWFRSRIAWFADRDFMTLGGVGAFIPKEILINLDGWDENALTEDAKLGILCSKKNYKFKVVTDDTLTIKEETPKTVDAYIKQRTRWILGFLQIISEDDWKELSLMKQIYFLLQVMHPFLQIFLYFWSIATLFNISTQNISITLLSYLPLMLLISQIVIQIEGLVLMLYARGEWIYIFPAILVYLLSYIPYQFLICISAIRALSKMALGNFNWEKTPHLNIHRLYNKELSLANKS